MKVYTETVQFKADQKLIDFIQGKLEKIDHYYDRVIDAHVTLKLENAGQVKDKIAEVRLNVPGETLVVKETQKTFEASVNRAVDGLKRQLIKYKERLRQN